MPQTSSRRLVAPAHTLMCPDLCAGVLSFPAKCACTGARGLCSARTGSTSPEQCHAELSATERPVCGWIPDGWTPEYPGAGSGSCYRPCQRSTCSGSCACSGNCACARTRVWRCCCGCSRKQQGRTLNLYHASLFPNVLLWRIYKQERGRVHVTAVAGCC